MSLQFKIEVFHALVQTTASLGCIFALSLLVHLISWYRAERKR